MNVAYVSNVVYPFVTGGAEKRIYEIGTRLVDRGHDVTVYGRQFWDGPRERTDDGLRLRGVAPERDLYVNGRRSIREAIGFAARLWRPLGADLASHDVVVASVFPYFPVFPAAARTWLGDVPLVTTWHECWRGYWRDYLGTFGVGGMAVERAVAALPQHPVAVSRLTADRLAGIGPGRDRIRVVPNGIDVDRIRRAAPASEGFDLLFVGRLIEAKNVDSVLRALATLDGDLTLGVVGDGPRRADLEALAAELSVAEQVSFLGFLDDYADVLAQMQAATVFVAPSSREGFGITLLEAMAAGCRVVAVEGPRTAASEVLGSAGVLVGPSVDALRRGIERALADPAEGVPERVEQYDWAVVTDRELDAYRHAVDGTWDA